MAAQVNIKMSTETFVAARALLQFLIDGKEEQFKATLMSQGRSENVTIEQWTAAIAEQTLREFA